MTDRQGQVLQAIRDRIQQLEILQQSWLGDARNRVAEHGIAAFNEVKYVQERGCRGNARSLYGRDGSRAEQATIRRDIQAMELAGIVKTTFDGRLMYVMPVEVSQ